MKPFEKTIEVRWADVDQNRHVRHSAYYDYGAYVRIRFFTENGYNANKMSELNIGPVIFKEECSFLRELKPDDIIKINLLLGNCTNDMSKWELHHEIFNQQNEKAAHITVKGSWLDLSLRKLTKPPSGITNLFRHCQKEKNLFIRKNNTTSFGALRKHNHL